MNKTILLSSVVITIFSGCSTKFTESKIDFKPPKYVEQMPALEEEKEFVSTGSIFGQGGNPLFSDHKAMHVNDIVTVVVSEAATSSNSSNKKLSESDTSALGGGAFTSPGLPGLGTAVTNLNSTTSLGFNSSSTSSYTGQGSATKDASFTTTVSARVIKVLQNGNYYIHGSREILVDHQKQILEISGVIRPYDITQSNQINSSQISDAKILYLTEGDVDRAAQQGWGTQIIQSVWPF